MRPLSTEAAAGSPGPVTPASTQFAPFSPRYLEDPYPTLASLREEEPVFFSPELGSWIVTRYATVKAVLRDNTRYSARIVSDPLTPLCPRARAAIRESGFDVPPLLVNNDPPSHSKYREFFGAALARERLTHMQAFVERAVDDCLDKLLAGPQPADLVAALTWDVPALVLLELLGIPSGDVPKVKQWATSRIVLTWGRPTDEEQIALCGAAIDYFRYAQELVAHKVQHPGDDYVSELLRMRAGDDAKATLHEIAAVCFNLLFAGHETTSSAATNLFKAALADRKLWAAITTGNVRLADVVEETLRLDPPVQSWRRRALADVTLDGICIPQGARLFLVFAAANRDPRQFTEGDQLQCGRRNAAQHVSFGAGPHFCLGAPLARMELEAMLRQVATRAPGMALVPGQPMHYTPNTSFRALNQLRVTW